MKTLISFALFAVSACAADVSGTWVTTFHIFGDTDTVKINLTDNVGKLTGSLNELKLEGTKSGDQIRFELEMVQFRGKTCRMKGVGFVDGQVVEEAEMMAMVVDR